MSSNREGGAKWVSRRTLAQQAQTKDVVDVAGASFTTHRPSATRAGLPTAHKHPGPAPSDGGAPQPRPNVGYGDARYAGARHTQQHPSHAVSAGANGAMGSNGNHHRRPYGNVHADSEPTPPPPRSVQMGVAQAHAHAARGVVSQRAGLTAASHVPRWDEVPPPPPLATHDGGGGLNHWGNPIYGQPHKHSVPPPASAATPNSFAFAASKNNVSYGGRASIPQPASARLGSLMDGSSSRNTALTSFSATSAPLSGAMSAGAGGAGNTTFMPPPPPPPPPPGYKAPSDITDIANGLTQASGGLKNPSSVATQPATAADGYYHSTMNNLLQMMMGEQGESSGRHAFPALLDQTEGSFHLRLPNLNNEGKETDQSAAARDTTGDPPLRLIGLLEGKQAPHAARGAEAAEAQMVDFSTSFGPQLSSGEPRLDDLTRAFSTAARVEESTHHAAPTPAKPAISSSLFLQLTGDSAGDEEPTPAGTGAESLAVKYPSLPGSERGPLFSKSSEADDNPKLRNLLSELTQQSSATPTSDGAHHAPEELSDFVSLPPPAVFNATDWAGLLRQSTEPEQPSAPDAEEAAAPPADSAWRQKNAKTSPVLTVEPGHLQGEAANSTPATHGWRNLVSPGGGAAAAAPVTTIADELKAHKKKSSTAAPAEWTRQVSPVTAERSPGVAAEGGASGGSLGAKTPLSQPHTPGQTRLQRPTLEAPLVTPEGLVCFFRETPQSQSRRDIIAENHAKPSALCRRAGWPPRNAAELGALLKEAEANKLLRHLTIISFSRQHVRGVQELFDTWAKNGIPAPDMGFGAYYFYVKEKSEKLLCMKHNGRGATPGHGYGKCDFESRRPNSTCRYEHVCLFCRSKDHGWFEEGKCEGYQQLLAEMEAHGVTDDDVRVMLDAIGRTERRSTWGS